jgi:hypothetical protein
MPTVSQQQRGLVFGKRNQYGSKENTPKKWKWVWEEEWENKGKLPKYKKKNKKKYENVTSFGNFLNESPYNSVIKEAFDSLGAKIEEIEIIIRNNQGRDDDLDMIYRVLADNLQRSIREFREQYDV